MGAFGKFSIWITPVWLIGMGALLGLLLVALAGGITRLISKRAGRNFWEIVTEGFLAPFSYAAIAMALIAMVSTFFVPAGELTRATAELPFQRPIETTVTVAGDAQRQPIEIGVPSGNLDDVELASDRDLMLAAPDIIGGQSYARHDLRGGEPYHWVRKFDPEKKLEGPPQVFAGEEAEFTVTNPSSLPAELRLTAVVKTEYPETLAIPGTALGVVVVFGLYFALRLLAPKVSAIALATTKEALVQPIFYVVLALGALALVVFVFVPYNTFGEDVKMLKDQGMTLIMLLAIVLALWTASVSISEEIEGRTALTVLSKPVGRRQFVLGKFVGILQPVALIFLVLGLLFLVTVSFKVIYDARESVKVDPSWRDCYREMIGIVPGLALAFMETVVLAAISVAISTRLPMLANLIICSTVYVLGHLTPMVVNSTIGDFAIVQFVGQFFATVLPVLDHFNIQAAVAAGAAVPLVYLGWAFLYCALYSSIAMLLALIMFEDRDLA